MARSRSGVANGNGGHHHQRQQQQQQQPRKWRRLHGLQAPLHPQQVSAWILLAAYAALMHLLVIPALASHTFRLALHTANGVLYLAHLTAHLAATVVDPADPHLRAKGREASRRPVPKFDRSL